MLSPSLLTATFPTTSGRGRNREHTPRGNKQGDSLPIGGFSVPRVTADASCKD